MQPWLPVTLLTWLFFQITHCPQCQRSNDVGTKAPMMDPYIASTPWTVIVINLTCLFPVSLQGNSHILTMTDLFTKWAIAEPIKSPTAYEVAQVVIKKLSEFGQVKKIITDLKMEFEDQVVIINANDWYNHWCLLFLVLVLLGMYWNCIAS